MNSVELRKKFLDEMAEPLLEQYIKVVKGEAKFTSNNATARVEMWSLLKHAIMSTKDTQKYEAENTQEVLKAMREGAMTHSQGMEVLKALRMQKDIDEEEGISEKKLAALGLTLFVPDDKEPVNKEILDPTVIVAPDESEKTWPKPY